VLAERFIQGTVRGQVEEVEEELALGEDEMIRELRDIAVRVQRLETAMTGRRGTG
jgi:hypothetical protein